MSVKLADLPFPVSEDVAITRHAIHDRWARVVGYHLLVADAVGRAPDDAARATASALVELLTGTGLGAVLGRRPAHVPIARRLLVEQQALALPAGRVVLEIDAADATDDAVLATMERLVDERHRITLVCEPTGPVPSPDAAKLADSVKLDVSGLSPDELADAAERFGAITGLLIADGVDDHGLLQRCRQLGFHAFQGFFYRVPELVRTQAPPVARLGELRALAGLYAQPITFEEFERIITRDVGLSYRLLAYLNSAFFSLPRHVSSVREALMMLGMKAVRRWAALVALSGAADKPSELTVTALVRGRLCELIGRRRPAARAGVDAYFTVGLFSVIDAIMDAPLEELLAVLPLDDEVREALLEHRGPMGDVLAAIVAYEHGDHAAVERTLPDVPMTELYLSAVRWADAACGALDRRDALIATRDDDATADGDAARPTTI